MNEPMMMMRHDRGATSRRLFATPGDEQAITREGAVMAAGEMPIWQPVPAAGPLLTRT